MVVEKFRGDFYFLSNFYTCPVKYNGITFTNAEAAFQSGKCTVFGEKLAFAPLSGIEAKKRGRKVKLRHDWELIKDTVMKDVCWAKFSQNPELKEKLLNTGDAELIEGNEWHDTYWGVFEGKGENKLGKILMEIREDLKQWKS